MECAAFTAGETYTYSWSLHMLFDPPIDLHLEVFLISTVIRTVAVTVTPTSTITGRVTPKIKTLREIVFDDPFPGCKAVTSSTVGVQEYIWMDSEMTGAA